MNLPIYTAALGAFLVVLQAGLMFAVGSRRMKGPPIGLGDDKDMERRVRRHGNLAENAGLFLAVLAIYELLVGQTGLVFGLCILFAVARALHAIGFSSLAGSHGEASTTGGNLFLLARGLGAMGTLATALGVAYGIVTYLA